MWKVAGTVYIFTLSPKTTLTCSDIHFYKSFVNFTKVLLISSLTLTLLGSNRLLINSGCGEMEEIRCENSGVLLPLDFLLP